METTNQLNSANCLADGGEMGALMRTLDWSKTPVGPVAQWPQSLRTTVSILLNSRFPMFLFWGAEATCLYNDGYRPSLGAHMHPQALGQRGRECWADIWHIIGPQIAAVMTRGEQTWHEDQLVPFDRNGYFEEIYFTYSYSPVHDEAGVGGTLVVCTETTKRVIGERRLRILRELTAQNPQIGVSNPSDAYLHSLKILHQSPQDIPFALLYQLTEDRQQAYLVGASTLSADHAACIAVIPLHAAEGEARAAGWPLAEAVRTQQSVLVDDLPTRFGFLPGGAWPEPTHSALILPIMPPGQSQLTGLLIVGVSPRKALDDDYRGFLELVAGQLGTAIANARAYEAERNRAEALAELNRAKTTFFSNVSHEFRTPLTLLLGPLAELLTRQPSLPPEAYTQIEVAHRNGLRLLKLVNILLDFSRLEAGRAQVYYEPVELASYTAGLANAFQLAIEQAGLRFVVDCPRLPESIYVDREIWEKIVLNLLSNALKFTFAGEIAVTQRWGGDHVALTVRDTGVGIPAAELPNIFKRFHRVRGTHARTHEGSGIGLALVQELVWLHGGVVRVASVEGQGATFTVELPTGQAHLPVERIGASAGRTHPEQSPIPGAAPYVDETMRWLSSPAERGEGEKRRKWVAEEKVSPTPLPSYSPTSLLPTPERSHILLADDNADMRDYLVQLLAPHYTVETVTNGQAALAAVLGRLPDLVLADVMMPQLDGFGLLAALRAEPRTRLVPVIILSARAGEDARLEGLDAGADDYLIKPFSARELLARVRAHLTLQRVRQEAEAQLREFNQSLERQVTERTNELTKRNQELDQFAYIASHDLRAPLRAIDKLASWISQDTSDILPATSKGHLDKLRGRVKRMEKLLDDLLAYSRAGRVEHTPERVDTGALVADVIRLVVPPTDFTITVQAAMPVLTTMRIPLELVFRNLIGNAIKHHDLPTGHVQVAAQTLGDWIEFAVSDDGPGIAPQFHERIFQMFQTLRARDQVEGSGMGLAIVKQMVESQGGRITVDSAAERGATFRFTWPK